MTQKETWPLVIFSLAAIANLIGNFLSVSSLAFYSKPILLISLIGYFIVDSKKTSSFYLFLGGLILCLFGDVFLMFNQTSSDFFFLAGLSSFLLGHICYYLSFKDYLKNVEIKDKQQKYILPGIMVFFTIIFLSQLIPYVSSEMRLPVTAYALIITLMMIGASKVNTLVSTETSKHLLIGAMLFTLSDCILAMAIFRFQSEAPAFIIANMGTYLLAQFIMAIKFKALLKDLKYSEITH